MTSSPTREEVEAVLVALGEATKEGAGPLAQRCEDMLRALLARAEAAEAERDEAERLALANEDVARAAVAGVMALTDERDAARAEAARLREALTFYANPQVYAPHPHGPAFDRRDLSWHARAALAGEAGRG